MEKAERRAEYLRGKITRAQLELEQISPGSVQPAKPERFKDINVLIGCPCYGGLLQHVFVTSLISLSQSFVNLGIRHHIRFLANHSLIPLARDVFANTLFEGDSTGQPFSHLLFLDVDQGFQAFDVLRMISAEKEIIGLPASLKTLNWENIARAAKLGAVPDQLPNFGGKQNFDDDLKHGTYQTDRIVEANRVGSALLLIRRDVFEKLIAAHPEWEHKRFPHFKQNPTGRPDYHFFQVGIDKETGYMLSEDYFFCTEARKLGIKVWLVPDAVTSHVGTFDYLMNCPAIASLGPPSKEAA